MIDLRYGDCLEVMKEIPDESVNLILCDLPYGTTKCKWDVVIPFDKLWEQYNRLIKEDGAIVLFGKEPFSSQLRVSNLDMYKYDWIWVKDTKSNFMQANHQPLNNVELISVFGKGYVRSIKDKVMMTYNPQFTEGKEYKLPKVSKTTDYLVKTIKMVSINIMKEIQVSDILIILFSLIWISQKCILPKSLLLC